MTSQADVCIRVLVTREPSITSSGFRAPGLGWWFQDTIRQKTEAAAALEKQLQAVQKELSEFKGKSEQDAETVSDLKTQILTKDTKMNRLEVVRRASDCVAVSVCFSADAYLVGALELKAFDWSVAFQMIGCIELRICTLRFNPWCGRIVHRSSIHHQLTSAAVHL